MGKPLQQDENGNIMNDEVTKENQKGYANYEMEQQRAQAEREAKDESTKNKYLNMMKSGLDLLNRPIKKAKGGSVSSASKRADGCAIKGKTRGKMV